MLPADWQVRPLGELLVLAQYGLSVRGNDKGRYPILRMTNQVAGQIVARDLQFADIDRSDLVKFRVEPGDLLFNRTNSFDLVGRTAIFGLQGDFVFASYLIRLRTSADRLNPHFLNFYLNGDATQRRLKSIATRAVSQSNISATRLKTFQVPVPPLDEQYQIARVLSSVQGAIERQERLIALTAELKRALMHKLFTEGIYAEPLKETEIGLVPKSWNVVALGSLAKIGNGSTPKRDNATYWEGGTIPWLTSGKVHESRIKKAEQYVTSAAKAECHLPLVNAGSLLIAITGEGKTLGNAAIVEFDTCVSQHLAYAQFHRADVVPTFLLYFLQYRYNDLRRMSVGAGSTKKALTCGVLKRYMVPIPNVSEQERIATTLDAVVAKMEVHRRTAEALRSFFHSVDHRLMTAEVRVGDLNLTLLDEAVSEPAGMS